MIFIAIDDGFGGLRIDNVLSAKLSEISRSKLQKLIKSGGLIDNKTEKPVTNPSYIAKLGQEFRILPQDIVIKTDNVISKNIPLDVVYEDQYMMVINKQKGFASHSYPGNPDNNLVSALLHYCGDKNLSKIGGFNRLGIVHRLDKDTSGLMLVAKNDEVHVRLSEQIASREVKRYYLALVYGVPLPTRGVIKTNIDRIPHNRLKMQIVKFGGKEAITNYETLKSNVEFSLVECKLDTGRTHQIRVHMQHIKHPIIGDAVYGKKFSGKIMNEVMEFVKNFPRQALHSYKIEFTHPIFGDVMKFESELPDDMNELIKILGLI